MPWANVFRTFGARAAWKHLGNTSFVDCPLAGPYWFLQRIGRGWRWHVGGVSCDGGRPAPGRWTHLIGTFDGGTARLYQDGRLAAEQACDPIRTPWRGQFLVGQYSGGPSSPYQVIGWISGVKVYNRALSAKDASAAFADSPAAVAR